MGLSGWTWNIFGIVIAAISGAVYLFVPRNGSPNAAMGLFFFIGIIFIVIGVTKLFFNKKDEKDMMNAFKQSEKVTEQKTLEMPIAEERQNRVEAALNKAMQEAQAKQSMQQHQGMQNHTNSYRNIHQYTGPVYNPAGGTHTQHPVNNHIQAAEHHAAHPAQNSEHGIRCRKCGNVNSGHANYCHGCGNRLK